MSEFLAAAFSLPTAIFSVLMILMGLYWITFLFGLFDLEALEGLFDGFGGAAEGLGGAVEGLGGAAEGLGGAAEGMVAGATEGAAEGLGGAADGLGDHDGCLGLGGVPTIITMTAFTVFGWLGSYFGMSFISSTTLGVSAAGLLPIGVGIGSVVASLVVTAISLRPLKRAFRLPPVTGHTDLVGKVCTLTTSQVTSRFGQAEVLDDSSSTLLIQVRCNEPNDLKRGQAALIFDYDPATQVFHVAPPRAVVEAPP